LFRVNTLLKKLIHWNLLLVPIGAVTEALFELFSADDQSLVRWVLAIQGGLVGAAVGLVAGSTAALTNTVFAGPLRQAGGSERFTGLVVSAGTLAAGLVLLNL